MYRVSLAGSLGVIGTVLCIPARVQRVNNDFTDALLDRLNLMSLVFCLCNNNMTTCYFTT